MTIAMTAAGTGPAAPATVRVRVHEHDHEVPVALLHAELSRTGPPPRLPLLMALIHHAPQKPAIARLTQALSAAPTQSSGPSQSPGRQPGAEHAQMQVALGLLRLSAREPAALSALSAFAGRLGGAAGAIVAAGVILLRDGPAPLCQPGVDALLLRQSSRALCEIAEPAPFLAGLPALVAAWVPALQRAGKQLGVQSYRAYLGDVSEALYRVAQRTLPRPHHSALLSEDDRVFLLDTIAFELPGTADFLAARQMCWLLPVLGPLDDADIAAIERARDRFRNEAFHADCALILSGGTWPPGVADHPAPQVP